MFRSLDLVDLVLGVVVIETLVLLLLWRWRRRGIAPRELLPNILAGFFLVLAVRCALTDAPWFWLALCLAAAGIANTLDLRQRWR